jgi:hypothetical protein
MTLPAGIYSPSQANFLYTLNKEKMQQFNDEIKANKEMLCYPNNPKEFTDSQKSTFNQWIDKWVKIAKDDLRSVLS